jgi:parallel beta-helix repeat protein
MFKVERKLAVLMIVLFVLENSATPSKVKAVADTTIYIRANGAIEPYDAPISSLDNVTYTFSSNITGSVVVEKNNVIIDGNGYTLKGLGDNYGFYLNRINITVKRTNIEGFMEGIRVDWTTNIRICENRITANSDYGIHINFSSNTTIVENSITLNTNYGIFLDCSPHNTISGNNLTSNKGGFYLDEAHNNRIIENIIAESNDCGMHLYLSKNNTIARNIVRANSANGIYLRKCIDNYIVGNNITEKNYDGIRLENSSTNAIVDNNIISNDDDGIELSSSSWNKICGNNITSNYDEGISLLYSSNNSLLENRITKNGANGIGLSASSNNTISRNTLLDNYDGILMYGSFVNSIYCNNFINNTNQVRLESGPDNFWDNGIEGNYWSDYDVFDLNRDGIGDSPREIDATNWDNYPLMGESHSFNAPHGYSVNIVSNSTIEGVEYFEHNNTLILHVSSNIATQKFGFCRICIPRDLICPPYKVIVDNGAVETLYFNGSIYTDENHTWIYFAYEQSTRTITIFPDRSYYYLAIIVAVALLYTVSIALIITVYRRKKARRITKSMNKSAH